MSAIQTVPVRGIDVACRIEGPAGAPVVLLAHGVLASHRMWDGVAAHLASGWRVVRYDLRGHGGTTATPAPYSIDMLACDAVSLMDALSISRAHFIGTSLGGMIGQVLGAAYPERLLSLTLANTTAVQSAPKAWEERARIAAAEGVDSLVAPTLARWFTPQCFQRDPALIELMRTEALQTSVEGFVGCALALRDLAHLELLDRIRVPTLVVAGEHDVATPVPEARAIARAISGSRLVVLPAAHQAAAECPGMFVAAWKSAMADM